MFARSAAPDTLQGKAIQAVNEKWGQVMPRNKRGRETIGVAVCKKKYAPFRFYLEKQTSNGGNDEARPSASTQVRVERMFGCSCHHNFRKSLILQHGERPGWEPFGQWSLRKAQQMARSETARLLSKTSSDDETDWEESSKEDLKDNTSVEPTGNPTCFLTSSGVATDVKCRSLCSNGNCLWKVKTAYDNVQEELLLSDRQAEENECDYQIRKAPSDGQNGQDTLDS